jgi:hypothetical protein
MGVGEENWGCAVCGAGASSVRRLQAGESP